MDHANVCFEINDLLVFNNSIIFFLLIYNKYYLPDI